MASFIKNNFKNIINENKIIVAVNNLQELEVALKTDSKIIFVLIGDICNIEETTRKIRSSGKLSIVHIDMIAGLNSRDTISLDFIKENTYADGIITTKMVMAKYAKKIGLIAIQRCFVIDSLSLVNVKKILKDSEIDAIEILPGVMPKILKEISLNISIPLIAGGLISSIEDVENAILAGADAVSTTKLNLKYSKIISK